MTFNRTLGIRLVRKHRDGVTIECPLRAELMNGAGVLHGGVAASLADAAVGIALWNHFGGKRPVTTVEMKKELKMCMPRAGTERHMEK